MAWFVYILDCNGKCYYTGITWNLKKRIKEHNLGIRTMIQPVRRPVKLLYWETTSTRVEAARREREIKGWRREKREERRSN